MSYRTVVISLGQFSQEERISYVVQLLDEMSTNSTVWLKKYFFPRRAVGKFLVKLIRIREMIAERPV